MKPFSTIAIPHKDILEGKLTIDIFAADLWEVFKQKASEEYKDKDIFFRKTFITSGLKNLLEIAERRLKGEGGEPVIQLQTPFGGGKTHSLIALYHKAKEWGANVVVICGDKLSVGENEPTLWEIIEEQLEGKIEKLKGKISPGGEKLKEFLQKHQPLLILFDEIHAYTVKAAGISVGESNLGAQTFVFLQTLTTEIKNLEKTILFTSLPSSNPYPDDQKSELFLHRLQNIFGRIEKIYTPVQDEEISEIIRKRLFSEIIDNEARKIIDEFVDYAEKEKILPEGIEKSDYRQKFLKSYPFQPEVIDVLYKRWGSFPNFQRTRGVLRLLALVVSSLKNSSIPFIRLSDFDLKNNEIKRELIKYIGDEYESIIYSDITSLDSGAKKVDKKLGSAYIPYSLGTKVATTIFMYSFSGGPEKGATLNEIKLSCATVGEPSSIITDTIEKLKEHLYYLSDTGLFFTNQPNLNRIISTKMENISPHDIETEEINLLKNNIEKNYFEVYIMPTNSRDIPDNQKLKLIVLKDNEKLKDFLEYYGDRPRIYRNTLIFLYPSDNQRANFNNFVKNKLAYKSIEEDTNLNLTDEQRKKVKNKLQELKNRAKYEIRNLYRIIFTPSKEGFKEIDLGIPTYGEKITIDKEIYERLRNESQISEKLHPSVIERYLNNKDYVETKNILETFYKTPGEIRITKNEIFEEALKEGVKQGLFGIGKIENGKPVCYYFKKDCKPTIEENEIIIQRELCKIEVIENAIPKEETPQEKIPHFAPVESNKENEKIPAKSVALLNQPQKIDQEKIEIEAYNKIRIKLKVVPGKFFDLTQIVNIIKRNFDTIDIIVEISAENGKISKNYYEDKIKETIKQTEMKLLEEELS